MHMGSGDTNYNIVDNEVQKDPITNYPIMHASGIKGALRDYFKALGVDPVHIKNIFGSEKLDTPEENRKKTEPGMLKFLSAQTFFLPIQSADCNEPYYIATSIELLKSLSIIYTTVTDRDLYNGFKNAVDSIDGNATYFREQITIQINDAEYCVKNGHSVAMPIMEVAKKVYPDKYDYNKLLILPNDCLSKLPLPIMARNQLNNGISKNLWYEEVVPHGASFVFGVLSDGTKTGDDSLELFNTEVEGRMIQFGGNASIGCGLTKVIKLS
jgi:CRISPR-associated protein Cmr4